MKQSIRARIRLWLKSQQRTSDRHDINYNLFTGYHISLYCTILFTCHNISYFVLVSMNILGQLDDVDMNSNTNFSNSFSRCVMQLHLLCLYNSVIVWSTACFSLADCVMLSRLLVNVQSTHWIVYVQTRVITSRFDLHCCKRLMSCRDTHCF